MVKRIPIEPSPQVRSTWEVKRKFPGELGGEKSIGKAKVLYSFKPEEGGFYLPLIFGPKITILDVDKSSDWYFGRCSQTGQCGALPANLVLVELNKEDEKIEKKSDTTVKDTVKDTAVKKDEESNKKVIDAESLIQQLNSEENLDVRVRGGRQERRSKNRCGGEAATRERKANN